MRIDAIAAYLCCPVCGEHLSAIVGLRCPRRHLFDIARQGYAQLTAEPLRHTGDTAEMVRARTAFLAEGHYRFIAEAIAAHIPAATEGLIVEVGGGTAYHVGVVVDGVPGAVGVVLDASKAAVKRAAMSHPRVAAAVCDAWSRLPLRDGTVQVLLNVFAPRNVAEFKRVLAPDGMLLMVTPEPDHLTELVQALGLLRVDTEKERRLAQAFGRPATQERLHRTVWLARDSLKALVCMGPSAWHTTTTVIDDLPEPFPVTVSVRLRTYQFRSTDPHIPIPLEARDTGRKK